MPLDIELILECHNNAMERSDRGLVLVIVSVEVPRLVQSVVEEDFRYTVCLV